MTKSQVQIQNSKSKIQTLASAPVQPVQPSSPPSPESSTEQRILQAARREFIDKGLAGARMQVISERAGVNKALLHYYFRSKQKLYEASLQSVFDELLSALNTALPPESEESDFEVLLEGIVKTYIGVIRSNPDFLRLLLRELADGAGTVPAVGTSLLSTFEPLPRRMLEAMKKGISAGTLRDIEPPHLMLNVISMCLGSFLLRPLFEIVHRAMTGKDVEVDDRFYSTRIRAITDMTFNGILTRTQP